MSTTKLFEVWHIVLAVALVMCLFRMPYTYYTLLTILTTFSMAVFVGRRVKSHDWNDIRVIFYVAVGLIFNPFKRPYMGKVGWNIVDVLVALVLIYFVYLDRRSPNVEALNRGEDGNS